MSKGIYGRFTGKPAPSIYPSTNNSSNNDIGKSLMSTAGAGEDRGMLVGITVRETINFGNTLAQTSSDEEVTIQGARMGDQVLVSCETALAENSGVSGFVSADDTVKVRFNNYSSGPINPAEAVYVITVTPVPTS